MKTKTLMIIALALSLPASTLLAQNDGPPPGGPGPGGQSDGPPDGPPGGRGPGRGRRPPPMPLIAALDANRDGVLSAEEIANASAALKTLDKNGDGQLTKDEYLPPRPPGGRGGPGGMGGPPDGPPPSDSQNNTGAGQNRPPRPIPPIVKALDADGDGVISAAEIANASAALLSLDKNGDGQLTMDELMGPRPPRRGGNGPDGPGDGQRPPPPDDGDPGDVHRPPPPSQNGN